MVSAPEAMTPLSISIRAARSWGRVTAAQEVFMLSYLVSQAGPDQDDLAFVEGETELVATSASHSGVIPGSPPGEP